MDRRVSTPEELAERIADRIWFDPRTECSNWLGSFFPDGYGQVSYKNRPLRVHRAVMELCGRATGMLDKTNPIQVLHTCDNPGCVNPDHLVLGTVQDNMRDRNAKGRQAKGARVGRGGLTEEAVKAVRLLRRQGVMFKDIAREFGVSVSCIEHVMYRRTWRHVGQATG